MGGSWGRGDAIVSNLDIQFQTSGIHGSVAANLPTFGSSAVVLGLQGFESSRIDLFGVLSSITVFGEVQDTKHRICQSRF